MSPYIIPGLEDKWKVSIDVVINAVSEHTGVSRAALLGRARYKSICYIRQLAMYLLRVHCKLTLKELSKLFKIKDHSTISYNIEKVEDFLSINDEQACNDVEKLNSILVRYTVKQQAA